jgi:hypothetical protein
MTGTTKKVSEYLKYQFSMDETRENAKSLARKAQELVELELKKKQLAADLKSEMETASAIHAKLARWVNDEYDFRMIECEVRLDSPVSGMKSTWRIDTGELIKEERMSPEELQQSLNFRQ